ncbi:hypothetical protein [Myroides fluvii]|uniref:hypothetical protein n=1 Tax=Myroides fluvii TaxID=2572594 RepID=UPI00131A992F|nr:hypothetical protein [Myroides fluvii]
MIAGAWKMDEIQFFAMDDNGFPILITEEKTSHFVNTAENDVLVWDRSHRDNRITIIK